MPELPEVETISRKLQVVLPGKELLAVQTFHPKSLIGNSQSLSGLIIKNVSRRAKIIRISLSQQKNVLIHLKMTGQLIYLQGKTRVGGGHPTDDWLKDLPSKHTRVQLTFTDESNLFFNDQRLFGWLKIQTDKEVIETFSSLAPDIIDAEITPTYLAQKLKNRTQAIKQLLMDTSIISGIGNIYANDALHLARIHPQRPGKSLSSSELDRLVTATKQVIEQGIALGGTTFDGKYVDVDGLAGNYQTVMRVYGRAGKACQNCGGNIVKIHIGGRGTYFCPSCQK